MVYQIKPTTDEHGYDVFRICDPEWTCDGEAATVGQAETIDYARFFAASPLMLEALQRMIKYIEAGAGATAEVEYGSVLNQARAAIAAAEGE